MIVKKKNFLFQTIILVIGQNFDRTTNFPYVDDSFIMDNYENFEEMVKTPLDRGNVKVLFIVYSLYNNTILFSLGPYFDISASKNVTALVGTTAYLNCRIKNLQNRTVI